MTTEGDTKPGWCWSADGESWATAATREEAISAAQADYERRTARNPGRIVAPVAHIGQCQWSSHEDFMSGLGADVRENIAMRAYDEAGDGASEYPDMKSEPFDEALEAFVLAWLKEHADHPRFYSVEDEETVSLEAAPVEGAER